MTVQDRIESRINKDISDCWLWQGGLCKGYGHIKIAGKTKKVHRVYWEILNGPIPDGLFVCHNCDIRNCVNPTHLFVGTHTDNMQDMIKKGRKSKMSRYTGITHCKHGHPFDDGNTRYYTWKGLQHRCCRTCDSLRPRREK